MQVTTQDNLKYRYHEIDLRMPIDDVIKMLQFTKKELEAVGAVKIKINHAYEGAQIEYFSPPTSAEIIAQENQEAKELERQRKLYLELKEKFDVK